MTNTKKPNCNSKLLSLIAKMLEALAGKLDPSSPGGIIPANLLLDYYKTTHNMMLPKGINKSVSYWTSRMSRVDMWKDTVMFGLQPYIKTYLMDYWQKCFFDLPEEYVVAQTQRVLDNSLGSKAYHIQPIIDLHRLGYLPIEIWALPEGTRVPIHVPMFCITNTHDDFAWLPQMLESHMSAEVWHPMVAATVGATYRDIVNEFYDRTCDDNIPRAKALGSFDFRGDHSLESAQRIAAAWMCSFLNIATVPAIQWVEDMYSCDCTKAPVGYGAPSTEHAVMCSNFAVDGDEITFLRHILKDIYPDVSFSCVLDSYDYWNVIENILPQLKPEIMAHKGCMLMRGDSGDCVKVVTQTVFKLWDIFGGTINTKGYKVLDPHVKAIYGDSITVERCRAIFEILEANGFACSNVALGVGSFSFHCIEENDILKPFTRDTFGACIKATAIQVNHKDIPIFKDPKEGGFKTSQKGCCVVFETTGADGKPTLAYTDQHSWAEACNDPRQKLQPVFRDGKLLKDFTLDEVRAILNNGKF